MKCLTVACHIQPTDEWINALPGCEVIITDDSDGKIKIDRENVRIYDYAKQKAYFKSLEKYHGFTAFQKSSACKNFGHLIAYQEGYDIVGIDSDCICPPDLLEKHKFGIGEGWENPLEKIGIYPRGYPYKQRNLEVVANMGMWGDCLDINGADRTPNEPKDALIRENKVVHGKIPFSGMNFSIRRDFIKYFLFLPNFDYQNLKFRRHDDIFGGYIFQKFLELKGKVMTYGLPIVRHVSEPSPEDAANEEAMNKYDMEFYKIIDEAFTRTTDLHDFSPKLKGTKFEALEESINWWKNIWTSLG